MEDQFYAHAIADKKWQARWRETEAFKWSNDSSRPKYYILEMFPYTSGKLHIGHSRNYAMGDTLARFYRARGFDVLYPMGWDAFGLPAENAAINGGKHPRLFTDEARDSMKAAMDQLGLSYDWSLEINTSKPEYTRAQQQLFIEFFNRGLVYRDTSYVNWCPTCNTVLANEQVIDGKCWRSQSEVIKRQVPQWFFAIRKYADQLLDGLDKLTGWPESVKNIQRSWIGRSEGTEVIFQVEGQAEPLKVFTTRPDTLFGCTFLVVAPEHPLLDRIPPGAAEASAVKVFRQKALITPAEERASEGQQKVGVFTGQYAVNPINGERVPIWTANYVLMDYGTGAVMAVPAHDQRDFDFAVQYHLPIRQVIRAAEHLGPAPGVRLDQAYESEGILINSGPFDGLTGTDAIAAITSALSKKAQGNRTTQYRLQNWSISRQRYWGNPIPIVYCQKCGAVPIPESELPLLLPDKVEFNGTGSPLSRDSEFMETSCPRCGEPAQRDPDTMDTFVDSSWYYLRYPTPRGTQPFDKDLVNRMLPVDVYVGGVEHATLHLLYSRFMVKALRDFGMLSFDEPFTRLYNQGIVNDSLGRRQSKSAGNVVEPKSVIDRYGADSLRVYLLFATAYNFSMNWIDTGPEDAHTYLMRVWRLRQRMEKTLEVHPGNILGKAQCVEGHPRSLRELVHQTIQKVAHDTERFQFNTAIAALMVLTNALYAYPADQPQQPAAAAFRILIRLLGIFAPHIAEEIWEKSSVEPTAGAKMLVDLPWPEVEADALVPAIKTIAVQVGGKFVTSIDVPQEATESEVLASAHQDLKIAKRIEGKLLKKVIYVPNRLLNLLLG